MAQAVVDFTIRHKPDRIRSILRFKGSGANAARHGGVRTRSKRLLADHGEAAPMPPVFTSKWFSGPMRGWKIQMSTGGTTNVCSEGGVVAAYPEWR